jgi:hypothetical protein
MHYTTKLFKSASNLSQEEALDALQNSETFTPGSKIVGFYNQGGHWIAKVKIAEVEPCEHCEDEGCQHCKKTAAGMFEDIDESPADLHDEKHEGEESPLEELEEHDDLDDHDEHEESEDKKLKELEKKLDLLLDALGINEKGDEPKVPSGPEEGPADLPAAPSADKGPKHEPLPPGSGAKLKPGEVPNKPGMTPVGAPAFASVKTAACDGSCDEGSCEHCDKQRKEATSTPPNAVGMNPDGGTPSSTGPVAAACPKCGAAGGSCSCGSDTSGSSGPVTAFTASKVDSGRKLTIRQAKAQLENHYEGFRVARIKRDGDAIHARMEYVAGPNPVTRGEAQDSNAVYQKEFDQRLQENAINRQKAIRKVDPYYNMDPLNQSYENQKDQEFTEEHHELPYPGADEYSQNYF